MQGNESVYMKILRSVACLLNKVYQPIKENGRFFFFMYLIGVIVTYEELPRDNPDACVYGNLWLELFLDLYVVCLLLTFVPMRVRRWIRAFLYVIAYATTIADVFCWEKFQSTLNPSMLLLVGETDGREASEFFSSYFSADLLFSSVGLVLLIMLIHILCAFWGKVRMQLLDKLQKSYAVLCKGLNRIQPVLGALSLALLVWSACTSAHNKKEMVQMFSMDTIGSVEHELTTSDCAQQMS